MAAVNVGPGSYSDIINCAAKPAFQARVNYTAVLAAVTVAGESAATPNHTARLAYANKVLGQNYNVQAVVWIVLSNGTIAAESNSAVAGENIPDGDLLFQVTTLWNTLAALP